MTTHTDNPMPPDDAAAADSAARQQRRHARLKQAFETHHAAILQLALTFGSRELADAEDAVHDTYLVLFTQRGELLDDHASPAEVERRLRTYLYGSVRGRMMNTARGYATRARGNAWLDPASVAIATITATPWRARIATPLVRRVTRGDDYATRSLTPLTPRVSCTTVTASSDERVYCGRTPSVMRASGLTRRRSRVRCAPRPVRAPITRPRSPTPLVRRIGCLFPDQ